MKCIDDMFDWILEDIFKRLPRESRLICKEVCQRWLEILMTRVAFREDRRIYFVERFKNRIRPYATINNAKYDYEMTIYFNFIDSRGYRQYPDFVFLDAFLEKQSNIKNIEIRSLITPFPKPYTQITKLCINDHHRNRNTLRIYENLENLEHLEMSWIQPCMFGHENIHLPKLKYLKFMEFCGFQSKVGCADCAKSIAASFPAMEEFYGDFNLPDCASILQMMFKNWHNLKTMEFACNTLVDFESSTFDLEERPSLRDLEITTFQQQPSVDMQILIKLFPNLQRLLLEFREINNFIGLLEGVLQGMPKLRSLSMHHTSIPCTKETVKTIMNVLEKYGGSLYYKNLPYIQYKY